jgi:hypothetical protein
MPNGTLAQGFSTYYANGKSGSRVFNILCQRELWPKGLQQPMPTGTLAQRSSTSYANGDSRPRVSNNLCQWRLWPKDLQQPMPMGTLAQRSLITQCLTLKTLYTFQPHAHAFGTQCSHKTSMFQPVFFTDHTMQITDQAIKLIKYSSNHNSTFIFQIT